MEDTTMMRATEMSPQQGLRAAIFVTIIGLMVGTNRIDAQAQTADADTMAAARNHYQAGARLFDQNQYRAAIGEFDAANKLAPSGLLDYNIALCHERLGEVAEALARYRSYLARSSNPANRTEVEKKIAQLEQSERDRAAATNTVPSTAPNDSPPVPPSPSEPNGAGAAGTAQAAPINPAPTGDPELDRVAALDLDTVAKRHPEVSPALATTAASSTPPTQGARTGASAPLPVKDKNDSDDKPLYKRWWFWVVVAVSAVIVIDIASSGSSDTSTRAARMIYPNMGASSQPAQAGGFTLRF